MTEIKYVKGDATEPQGEGNKIIAQVVNNIGVYGAGFSGAVSRRWPEVEKRYRARGEYILGSREIVVVCKETMVANMVAQNGVRGIGSRAPIDYWALRECLNFVRRDALFFPASVHMPRIGCGLAGGAWPEVEKIIQETLCAYDIPVTVYDLETNNEQ